MFKIFLEQLIGRYLKLVGLKNFSLPSPSVSANQLMVGLLILVLSLGIFGTSEFGKSRLKLGYSSTLAENFVWSGVAAAQEGDYMLAQQLYKMATKNLLIDTGVLGAESMIEETIFPELIQERRLMELDIILNEQPTHTGALIEKAVIFYKLRLDDAAKEIVERLVIIDPNNQVVKELKKLILEE